MAVPEKVRHIFAELKGHAPFTLFGAFMGIVFMLVFRNISTENAEKFFGVFHPGHVFLSALVTAAMFNIHKKKRNFLLILIIGFVGSIGVATVSDSVVPFIGEKFLNIEIPTHCELHGHVVEDKAEDPHAGHEHGDSCSGGHEEHSPKLHLGFIEDWYSVVPAAILGVLIAYFIPRTRFPHAAHVLLSTWASSAHLLMNSSGSLSMSDILSFFVILFVAVWLPCCISDIVFPLLFVKGDLQVSGGCSCTHHKLHSHKHIESDPGEE